MLPDNVRFSWFLLVFLVGVGACGRSSASLPTLPTPALDVRELVPSMDYLLTVTMEIYDDDGQLKEQATAIFRGPLTLRSDGWIHIQGEGSVEGAFWCVSREDETQLLGPGKFAGVFPFTVQGRFFLSKEDLAAKVGEPLPAVVEEQQEEPKGYFLLSYPMDVSSPNLEVTGLTLSECQPHDQPVTSHWVVGLQGLFQGDGGQGPHKYIVLPWVEGPTYRALAATMPDLEMRSEVCLVPPGEPCPSE